MNATIIYALRAILLLESKESLVRRREIAKTCKTSDMYMSKILTALSKAGIVSGKAGPKGGFRLTNREVTLLEVANILDMGPREDKEEGSLKRGLDSVRANIRKAMKVKVVSLR